MLMFIVIFGVGLLIAGIYKVMDNGKARNAKLDRVQRKIAQLDAEQAARDKEMPNSDTKDSS
ncbi:hypothetical protein [Litorimonas sp. WD9-15]|uniref:hypothetical protein n=1 Tax=Litorimonas sp. WD9-15 TaxID=3418716 RepID=UPI003CFC8F1D